MQDLGIEELSEEEINELGLAAPTDFAAWSARFSGS
jgi:hypothetical protein